MALVHKFNPFLPTTSYGFYPCLNQGLLSCNLETALYLFARARSLVISLEDSHSPLRFEYWYRTLEKMSGSTPRIVNYMELLGGDVFVSEALPRKIFSLSVLDYLLVGVLSDILAPLTP